MQIVAFLSDRRLVGRLVLLTLLAAPVIANAENRSLRGRELRLPQQPYAYSRPGIPEDLQRSLRSFDNTPQDNPITDDGATLGRVLFYDKTLSANGQTSCASCHLQAFGFSEPKPTSVGFRGEQVTRNSMSLINLRYYRRDRFFWDERADGLERQVVMPIENPIEMGNDLDELVAQLQEDPIYPPLFRNAFGDPTINQDRIAKSLAQFVRSIVSFNSRYDEGLRKAGSPTKPFSNFTAQENLGKQVFFGRGRCAECHLPGHDDPEPNHWIFQLSEPLNNGIETDGPEVDAGVATQTTKQSDRGKFKTSTLRNLERTGPYMHDGRFHTIDQVIEHYNWSVQPHPNLDHRLRDFSENGLALPEVPKVALATFLLTLTDPSLADDPKFSDPFVQKSSRDVRLPIHDESLPRDP